MRYDYNEEKPERVMVKDIPCELFDFRLDLKTIPEGSFYYEIGHDDTGEPCRIQKGIAVDFFGSLVCSRELPLGEDCALWLEQGDICWM